MLFFFCGFLTSTSIRFYFSPKDRSIISSVLSLKLPLKLLPSSRAASTFRLMGRQPVKPSALASGGHSPSQPPNQQASLFMRSCYCWAVFRNKRKLKSLAVWRHPELRGWGAEKVGGRNERQKFLSFPAGVFQIPQATAPSAVRVKWAARGETQESRGEEETHILERTRHLRTQRRCSASVCSRLLQVPPASGLKVNAGRCLPSTYPHAPL